MIRLGSLGGEVLVGRGLIGRLADLLPPGRVFVVTDANVEAAGWAGRVREALGGRPIGSLVLPPGEASKGFARLEALLDALLEAGIERGDLVVAVGGGMVGDLAGFAAAIVKRGCGFVQVPTSLLAQADAAIGGKTAINARQGKNLIGAFHPPAAVVVDIDTLTTLPAAELRAGYAEIVKYGLIGDADFFAWCEEHGAAMLAGDTEARLHAIETSIRAKAAVVERDPRDVTGERALLNFGHSFGHAMESETGLRHGEAVALGMVLAFRLSAERGLCPAEDGKRVAAHFVSLGLPVRIEGVSPEALARHMAQDKKRKDGRLPLILTRGIGRAFIDDSVGQDEVGEFLEREAGSARLGVG